MIRLTSLLCLLLLLLPAARLAAQDAPAIQWETNADDPPIGDPKAIKGGTYLDFLPGYPKTFRLLGPTSNELFANWSRAFSLDMPLVMRHPTTDRFIPGLATHWSIQPDNKTVYFKLDPDARWSDGQPITADDYTFAIEVMSSPLIRDPFYNQYVEDHFESVEKVDTYTIKVTGKQPSWRPLEDFRFSPLPRHAMKLTETWVEDANYTPPVVQGPYTITEFTVGERVVYTRNANWWGYKKHYFQGMFNPDRIELKAINDDDRALDYFKTGELSYYTVTSAKMWATELEIDALTKGYAHKRRLFLEEPQGMSGIILNLQKPIFQNKDFRKALQYLFNFEELNEKLMYNSYYRQVSAFAGTEYENLNLKPYGFNPKKAGEHLKAAGFTTRGKDGILVRADGTRASFTLSYGNKSVERHLTVVQNTYKKAGVEVNLQLLEPVAYFDRIREKAYESAIIGMTSDFYPEPHQYFAVEFRDIPQTNNFWAFGTEETDKLIDTYRFDHDFAKRKEAMDKLDAIIQDEAFYIPFWSAPYTRFLYWDYVQWPDFYMPRRAQSHMEYQVFWIDPQRKAALDKAMKEGNALSADTVVDADPYGVKARLASAPAPTPSTD